MTTILKQQSWLTLAGLVMGLIFWFSPIPHSWQWIFFLLVIVTVGLPHGALDFLVAGEGKNKAKLSTFLFFYVSQSLAFLLLWFWPLAAASIFVVLSAYHFGETDLQEFNPHPFLKHFSIVCYGLATLTALLFANYSELITLIPDINKQVSQYGALQWLKENYLIAYFLLMGISLLILRQEKSIDRSQLASLLILSIPQLLIFLLPFLAGFTYYFGIWHSLLSIATIQKNTNASGWSQIGKLINAQTVSFALLALVIMGLLYWLISSFFNYDNQLLIFFIGLSILAIPHMQLMHQLLTRRYL
ncbi:MAG: Brp/Blh family beta-carotene 15,15'-dioxygenase [Sphingomonadales bacterium]